MNHFTTTSTGRRFHFLEPRHEDIDLQDIAYSLAHKFRWGCHAKPNISVGQHSVMVAGMLLRKHFNTTVVLQGLMHDAAEAYLGDIPTPLKAHLPDYQAIELICEAAIFARFSIPYPPHPAVKAADRESGKWEYRDLMPGDSVGPPAGNHPTLRVWGPEEAEFLFKDMYYHLKAELRAAA